MVGPAQAKPIPGLYDCLSSFLVPVCAQHTLYLFHLGHCCYHDALPSSDLFKQSGQVEPREGERGWLFSFYSQASSAQPVWKAKATKQIWPLLLHSSSPSSFPTRIMVAEPERTRCGAFVILFFVSSDPKWGKKDGNINKIITELFRWTECVPNTFRIGWMFLVSSENEKSLCHHWKWEVKRFCKVFEKLMDPIKGKSSVSNPWMQPNKIGSKYLDLGAGKSFFAQFCEQTEHIFPLSSPPIKLQLYCGNRVPVAVLFLNCSPNTFISITE